jgi:protein TonB
MVVETQPVEQALTPIQLPPAPAAIAITTPLAIRLPPSVVPAALAGLRTAPHPPRPLAKPAPSFGPAAAPPPQAVAPDTQNILAGLESRIRQAVRDALIYPAAARLLHREGRTRIRFDYTDGTVGAIDIATPSASALLDRAAIAAVRRAALPRAPTEIGNRRLAMLVWVDFRLASQ